MSYEYDPLGRELAVTHTDGRRIASELTPNGWVRAIPGVLDEVVYDARGLPIRLHYANGVVTEVAYTKGPGQVRGQRTTGPAGQMLQEVRHERDQLGLLSAQRRFDARRHGRSRVQLRPAAAADRAASRTEACRSPTATTVT